MGRLARPRDHGGQILPDIVGFHHGGRDGRDKGHGDESCDHDLPEHCFFLPDVKSFSFVSSPFLPGTDKEYHTHCHSFVTQAFDQIIRPAAAILNEQHPVGTGVGPKQMSISM